MDKYIGMRQLRYGPSIFGLPSKQYTLHIPTYGPLLYIILLWFLLFLILVTYYLVFDIVLTLDQQMVPQFFTHFEKGNQSNFIHKKCQAF
jgi:type IV secretory pathway VirB3-like protein